VWHDGHVGSGSYFGALHVPVKCPEYPVLRWFCDWEEELSRLNPAEPVGVWRVMSPTSYQTAPPRECMIAESLRVVKQSTLEGEKSAETLVETARPIAHQEL
jgi:hypothetical protein